MKAFIDTRENERIQQALYYFSENNEVSVEELETGDYIFENENGKVVFEYKTVEDFIHSINDNRVFNQSIDQYLEFDYHFIIIVGTEKDKNKCIKKLKQYTHTYMTNSQYYGVIAKLNTYTTVWQVPRTEIAFEVMEKQANKCLDGKHVVKQFNKSVGSAAFRLLLNNVNGIGYKTAETICNSLNLITIQDVFNLNKEDLCTIDGIGEKTAKKIINQLTRKFN